MEKPPEQERNTPFLPPEVEEEIRRDAEADGMDADAAVAAALAALQEEEE